MDLGIDSGQISGKGFEDHFDLAVHLAQPAGNQAKGSTRSARNTRINWVQGLHCSSQCQGHTYCHQNKAEVPIESAIVVFGTFEVCFRASEDSIAQERQSLSHLTNSSAMAAVFEPSAVVLELSGGAGAGTAAA